MSSFNELDFASFQETTHHIISRPQYGSCLPDDSRLSCNNIDTYECTDCGVEVDDLDEFITHQNEFDHHTEPFIIMQEEFLDLTINSNSMFNATGLANSTMLSNTYNLEHLLNSTVIVDPINGLPCLPNMNMNSTFGPNSSSGVGSSISNDSFPNGTFSDPTSVNQSLLDSKTFMCEYESCDYVGFNNQQLHSHLKKDHWKSSCPDCGKVYANQKCLRQHVKRVHERETNCTCDSCGKGFYARSNLKKHQITCNGGQLKKVVLTCKNTEDNTDTVNYKFYCRMTGCTTFYTSINSNSGEKRRLRHERSHSTDDEYSCTYCEAEFELYTQLVDHLEECNKRDGRAKHAMEVKVVDGIGSFYV